MNRVGYWVDLYQAEQRLGAGFLLTRRFVLTALHCLRGNADEETSVEVVLSDDRPVPGRVCRTAKDADLALIEIMSSHDVAIPIPAAHVARRGDRWRGPYRPDPGDAQLSGCVDDSSVRHVCEGGGSVEALQLTADQLLGDYSGYSGSPVEGTSPEGGPAVLGILLEQVMDRQSTEYRAANVLFAATVAEAMRRFDQFDVGHLIDVLRPPPVEHFPSPATQEPTVLPRLAERHSEAESLLISLQRWSESNLIDPTQAAQLRLDVVQRVIDAEFGPSRHDGRI